MQKTKFFIPPRLTWPPSDKGLCGLGSFPGFDILCSLLLVLILAPRGFSPGTPVLPSPQKPTFPNSNTIWTICFRYDNAAERRH